MQFWRITGASTRKHPAPFPLELAYRLVRMYSFVWDTVLDPFCGTGTTMLAAMQADRHSIGVEIDPAYCEMAMRRLGQETHTLFGSAELEFVQASDIEKFGLLRLKAVFHRRGLCKQRTRRMQRKDE